MQSHPFRSCANSRTELLCYDAMQILYRAGCEPFSIWEGLDPKSEEYRKLKEERAKILMDAVEVQLVEAQRGVSTFCKLL